MWTDIFNVKSINLLENNEKKTARSTSQKFEFYQNLAPELYEPIDVQPLTRL